MIRPFYSLVISAFFLLAAVAAQAQESVIIRGSITSEGGSPLPGANVFIPEIGKGAAADEKGAFEIRDLPPDLYELRVSMIGYQTATLENVKAERDPKPLRIQLKEQTVELEGVEIVRDAFRRGEEDTRVSVQNMLPREAKFLPGAAEDVLRSLRALPGVLAPNDFSSQLVIRGSGPDQNLIVMDGIEVFNPYRLYGAVSMFNPETVTDISLISGGFPAKYGDRLSAVLDITNRDGRGQKPFYLNANTSITNANIVAEGRQPFGIKGTWLLSTRRTYYDLIVGPIAKNSGAVQGDVAFPNFGDIQSRLTFTPWEGHKLYVTGVLSRDGVELVSGSERDNPDSVAVFNTTYNSVIGLGWHYAPGKNMLNKVVLSYYNNNGSTDFDARFLDPVLNREDFSGEQNDSLKAFARLFGVSFTNSFSLEKYSLKDEFVLDLESGQIEIGAGWDYVRANIFFDLTVSEEYRQILENRSNAANALLEGTLQLQNYHKLHAYAQDRIKLTDRWHLQPGLRLDYYGLLEKAYVSPRLASSYLIDPLTTLRLAVGLYYQSPGYEKLFDQRQFLDFSERNLDQLRAERAVHYVLGLERWIDNRWLLKAEGYYKDFSDLIVQQKIPGSRWVVAPVAGGNPKRPEGWTDPFLIAEDSTTTVPVNGSYGNAYGFEVMLEKRNLEAGDRFSGWISYGLAWAQRFRDGYLIPFNFDQRHTVNIVGNYRILPWLEGGMYWRLGSNFPYTEPIGVRPRIVIAEGEPVLATDFSGNVILDIDYGDDSRDNQARRPWYHRLDVRFIAFTQFWGMDWAFYLDVINVYNNKNVAGYGYFVKNDGTLGRRTTYMFPILPTIGVNARF